MKMNNRVLLTGASGSIGVHVLAHLMHNTDWEVVITDSFNPVHKGSFDRLAEVTKNHPDWLPRIKVIHHDLFAPFSEREIERMGAIDYVINLASRSDVPNSIDPDPSRPTGNSVEFVRNNTELMLNMLELARIIKPKVFLHFSTDEVYGQTPKDSGGHKEWASILPSNPYSASKAAQEALAIAWWRSYGVPLIITNTMNNFGEMQVPSKYPAMIQKKLELGETVTIHATSTGEIGSRYYIHSRNTADAVLFILKNVKPVIHGFGEMDMPVRLNIVGDRQVDNLELAQTIARIMGKELKYEFSYFHESNPGHDIHYGLDGSKLHALGWRSPLSFEESLKNTIEWQIRHPEWLY